MHRNRMITFGSDHTIPVADSRTSAAECLAAEIYDLSLTTSKLNSCFQINPRERNCLPISEVSGAWLNPPSSLCFYSCMVSSVPCTPQTTTSAVLGDDNGVLGGRGLGWLCSPLYTISATWPSIVVSTFLFTGQLGCVHL
jgi:hypothetical protein